MLSIVNEIELLNSKINMLEAVEPIKYKDLISDKEKKLVIQKIKMFNLALRDGVNISKEEMFLLLKENIEFIENELLG